MYHVAKVISGNLRPLDVPLIIPLANPKITQKFCSVPVMQSNEEGLSYNLLLQILRLRRI